MMRNVILRLATHKVARPVAGLYRNFSDDKRELSFEEIEKLALAKDEKKVKKESRQQAKKLAEETSKDLESGLHDHKIGEKKVQEAKSDSHSDHKPSNNHKNTQDKPQQHQKK